MSKSNPVYAFLSHNKYWIVLIVGILIVGVLDENSFYQRVKYDLQIEELKTKIAVAAKIAMQRKMVIAMMITFLLLPLLGLGGGYPPPCG